ncbi:MAG: preprotein translocase subunit YajC [Nocardioides sp.]|nr:preprotein translocase subunit YajC [Nocardioides sp.]
MDLAQLLPLVAILVLFWLIVIRPASRRQKDMVRLQQSLEVGQRVMLASGIFGTITALADDRVSIEVADGVVIQAARGAVSTVQPDPVDAPDEGTTEAGGA